MLNNMGLGFVFTATDLASSKMQALERSFLSLDKRVGLGTERITSSFREFGMGLSPRDGGLRRSALPAGPGTGPSVHT